MKGSQIISFLTFSPQLLTFKYGSVNSLGKVPQSLLHSMK